MGNISRQITIVVILIFSLIHLVIADNPQKKEFRGVWIATINNIDWPSSPNLTPEQQKREFLSLLDLVEKYNLNTVILQVRPAADAFYQSDSEPWSWFLTGKQGMPPIPAYDPLAWAIKVCHQRGIELHAWFNPFRIRNNGYYPLDATSFAAKNRLFTCSYDDKLFFDPGYPQVRAHIINVIAEVVRKYDIDAVHLDDYFYPYPVRGKAFPDQKSFAKYGKPYYPNKLKDWRRENINSFISELHNTIKSIKPNVKLGISPFGIWRNKADDPAGSSGLRGMSSYDDLYADVRKWLKEDWIDYIIPQLYWEQGNRFGDFLSLAKWWNENSFGKPLYIGQALYKTTNSNWNNPKEIGEQIRILREHDQINGFAFYSISHLKKLTKDQSNYLAHNFLGTKSNQLDNKLAMPDTVELVASVIPETVDPVVSTIPGTKELVGAALVLKEGHFTNQIVIPRGTETLPFADKISLNKSRSGWMVSWKADKDYDAQHVKFAIVTFQTEKDGGFFKKVQAKTENQQIFISKSEQKSYKNKLVCIIAINDKNEFGKISQLFKIRGRRVVFN